MDTNLLRKHLTAFLGRLSRLDYLAVFSALALAKMDPNDVATEMPSALKQFSDASPDESGRELEESAIEVQPAQIAKLSEHLPNFVIDLLLVDLEAFLHGFLTDAAEVQRSDDSRSLEALIGPLWPRDARLDAQEKKAGRGKEGRTEHWSYSDAILLSEVRNAIVHGNGEILLERSKQRLADAGWSEEALNGSRVLKTRGLNDLFRFKRAVRTLANEVLSHADRQARPH